MWASLCRGWIVADGITLDMSEVRAAIADMSMIDERLNSWVVETVERGAVNIKNQMREDMQASRHFRGAARGISYDMKFGGFGGQGVVAAEIGPEKGTAGDLANIAYFGTSRGGGTVRNPEYALADEMPRFAKAMADIAAQAVFG